MKLEFVKIKHLIKSKLVETYCTFILFGNFVLKGCWFRNSDDGGELLSCDLEDPCKTRSTVWGQRKNDKKCYAHLILYQQKRKKCLRAQGHSVPVQVPVTTAIVSSRILGSGRFTSITPVKLNCSGFHCLFLYLPWAVNPRRPGIFTLHKGRDRKTLTHYLFQDPHICQ